MNYILTTIQVLFAELAGVAVLTGILYVYWKSMTNK